MISGLGRPSGQRNKYWLSFLSRRIQTLALHFVFSSSPFLKIPSDLFLNCVFTFLSSAFIVTWMACNIDYVFRCGLLSTLSPSICVGRARPVTSFPSPNLARQYHEGGSVTRRCGSDERSPSVEAPVFPSLRQVQICMPSRARIELYWLIPICLFLARHTRRRGTHKWAKQRERPAPNIDLKPITSLEWTEMMTIWWTSFVNQAPGTRDLTGNLTLVLGGPCDA